MIKLRAFVDPAALVGDFCTESLLEKTSILHTIIPAAPLGDFCTESPAAPLGDYARRFFWKRLRFCALIVLVLLHP
jgi:hypothetical protein